MENEGMGAQGLSAVDKKITIVLGEASLNWNILPLLKTILSNNGEKIAYVTLWYNIISSYVMLVR